MIKEIIDCMDFRHRWGFGLYEVRGTRHRMVGVERWFRQVPSPGQVTRFKDRTRNLLRKRLKQAKWYPFPQSNKPKPQHQ
jgi:hypothetical protein